MMILVISCGAVHTMVLPEPYSECTKMEVGPGYGAFCCGHQNETLYFDDGRLVGVQAGILPPCTAVLRSTSESGGVALWMMMVILTRL